MTAFYPKGSKNKEEACASTNLFLFLSVSLIYQPSMLMLLMICPRTSPDGFWVVWMLT